MSAIRALRQASCGFTGAARLASTRRTGSVLARGAVTPSASASKLWAAQGVRAFSATARTFGSGASECFFFLFFAPFFLFSSFGPHTPRVLASRSVFFSLYILKFEKAGGCGGSVRVRVGARRVAKLPILSRYFLCEAVTFVVINDDGSV